MRDIIRLSMKYTFIVDLFRVTNIDTIFYIYSQT